MLEVTNLRTLRLKALDKVFFILWSTVETHCFLLTWFIRNEKHACWWLLILGREVARRNGRKKEFAEALEYSSFPKSLSM